MSIYPGKANFMYGITARWLLTKGDGKAMGKNIVLLSDGTGNSAGKLHKTNVWRTYKAIKQQTINITNSDNATKRNGVKQIAFYDDGVGTSSIKSLRLLGGAFGFGLKLNVIELYTFLSHNYQPGDQIYCFGFSRGAFTIRVLVALVASQGLAQGDNPTELRKNAKKNFTAYKRKTKSKPIRLMTKHLEKLKEIFRKPAKPSNLDNIQFQFVGVWDTVDAYGAPFDELKAINKFLFLHFPDRILSESVTKACQALSIDDERQTFHPLLWNENDKDKETNRIEQVWFSGMHSNIGGGYPDDNLAYVPLVWMLLKAKGHGLEFDSNILKEYERKANDHGTMYNSRSGLGIFYRYAPRKIEELANNHKVGTVKVHISVIERIKRNYTDYAPVALPTKYEVVDNKGQISSASNGKYAQLIPLNIWGEVKDNIRKRRGWYFCFVSVAAAFLMYVTWTSELSLNLVSAYLSGIMSTLEQHPVPTIGVLLLLWGISLAGKYQAGKIENKANEHFEQHREK